MLAGIQGRIPLPWALLTLVFGSVTNTEFRLPRRTTFSCIVLLNKLRPLMLQTCTAIICHYHPRHPHPHLHPHRSMTDQTAHLPFVLIIDTPHPLMSSTTFNLSPRSLCSWYTSVWFPVLPLHPRTYSHYFPSTFCFAATITRWSHHVLHTDISFLKRRTIN